MRDLQRQRLRPAKDGHRRRGGCGRKKQGNKSAQIVDCADRLVSIHGNPWGRHVRLGRDKLGRGFLLPTGLGLMTYWCT